MSTVREDAQCVMEAALTAAQPRNAVRRGLQQLSFTGGRLIVVSIGKAAWRMAEAALETLGDRVEEGIVITPYGYADGPLDRFT
ncbi:MAG: DUF4147 domain-containing protein, partial [Eubacteriales bacterium]|nr:DUF4147 domain-containing protein [Eubacteriales bacterium]